MPGSLRRGPLAAVAAALLFAALAGPAAALAAFHDDAELPPGPIAALFLEGSEGYKVQLLAFGRTVAVEASRGRVGAAYAVRGRAGPERIAARFGKLGRIDVAFHSILPRPDRGDRRPCARRQPLRIGAFRGTIRFRGEGGYTAVARRSAPGIVLDLGAKPCPPRARRSADQAPPPLDTFLAAIARDREALTAFELSRRRGERRLTLTASRQERREGMWIFRSATTYVGGPDAFLFSGPGVRPAFGTVTAPKPFAGSALFAEGPSHSASWSGSLTAWLPGAGHVPLAGPDFASNLCRRGARERGCNPLPVVRRPLWAPGKG